MRKGWTGARNLPKTKDAEDYVRLESAHGGEACEDDQYGDSAKV